MIKTCDPVAIVIGSDPGPPGGPGPRGFPGGVGEVYTHEQLSASTTWTINHNLGFLPAIYLQDATGQPIGGDITHVNVNQSTATFLIPLAGTARCI